MTGSFKTLLCASLLGLATPVHGSSVTLEADLILTDVTVYPSPDAEPLPKATVWIHDGEIVRVEPRSFEDAGETAFDPAARVLQGNGRVLTAGFWNSHVHFTPPTWADPRSMTGEQVAEGMTDMLLRWGFTSVVDTGADPGWLAQLRRHIETGVVGPRILEASGSFVGKDASPAYLDFKLPELATAEQAVQVTRRTLEFKPDGIKIFTGSFAGPGKALHMTQDVVDAVTKTAHAQDAWVIAHPQSLKGVELAVEGGVDILAHTAPDAGKLPPDLVKRIVERDMALVPTLQLWRYELGRGGAPPPVVERFQNLGVGQLRDVAAAGGEILFGTDVGYMTDFDPTEEYQKMSEAGLDFRQILASLTTAPSRRFLGKKTGGTVTRGQSADLVLLAADPADDPTAFAQVDLVVRGGRLIYESVQKKTTAHEKTAAPKKETAALVKADGP